MNRALVVGAGGGGLAAALELATNGMDVTVLESHICAGGCAGTFYHKNYRFDAGATLAGGFNKNGPMDIMSHRFNINWKGKADDIGMKVHLHGHPSITRWVDSESWKKERLQQFGTSGEKFWNWQEYTSNLLWKLAMQHPAWPPRKISDLLRLLEMIQTAGWFSGKHSSFLKLLQLSQDAFRPLKSRIMEVPEKMRQFIDAQLLISAQATSSNANALYSAAALDLSRQGVMHSEGGMGGICEQMVEKLRSNHAKVLFKKEITKLLWDGNRIFGAETKRGERFEADVIIVNLTRENASKLMEKSPYHQKFVSSAPPRDGWGAFMVYTGIDSSAVKNLEGLHHQLVKKQPLGNGNSVFLSISPEWDKTRAPENRRAITLSTHTSMKFWWNLFQEDKKTYEIEKERMAKKMLKVTETIIPGIREASDLILTGTPITFQRFTKRLHGWVGGFPQTNLFRSQSPCLAPGLWMVGDSIFPGQSLAAVCMGGMRVGREISKEIGALSSYDYS
ncbi:MAG: NAD(P)/FAD-dependent oxidoreductase [SAR324 cluster bacterium]|jgi:C-3',4' desaturase CrtD|nr:NAD(P)/FAD-dependent oxidoreductase [SAR324 cluster bacterium]MDP7502302.1 NAD(P)/FAD-dependent oxidoreductase [SAR324 cluster bacterium]MEE1574645.1 NAD(P)/FAD-dependent oxidoreductase [Deltaproteobacteria bacterium]|tara:strand:- start:17563 stop:19077 length:1515 start_codon:yes stop_codon:yes gene_type:complete